MVAVERRAFLGSLLFTLPVLRAQDAGRLRGKLIVAGDKPALGTPEGRIVFLDGDNPTIGVLKDARIAGTDFEVVGTPVPPDHFTVGPIHKRSMFVHKGDKKLMVTYWCDVCYIRTYSPGICWCCQKETDLDLIEHE
jgi:hypothetical protein